MIQPGIDKVLISCLQPETVRASGIILPQTVVRESTEGEVLAIGICREQQPNFKVGDRVAYEMTSAIGEISDPPAVIVEVKNVLLSL